jgi:hypothetical protein
VSTQANRLRDALLGVLLDAVENGPLVVDPETGEPARVTPDPKVLTVALQAAKAFAQPDAGDGDAPAKAEQISRFLQRYQQPGARADA